MIYIIIIFVLEVLYISYEMWRAPMLDHNNKIVRPAKTFKQLFKSNKNGKEKN